MATADPRWASTFGAIGLGALMLVAEQAQWTWPDPLWWTVFGAGILLLLISVILWTRAAWQWWRSRRPPAISQKRSESERRIARVGAWYRMVDDIESRALKQKGNRLHFIQRELRKDREFHRLSNYLPSELVKEVNDPAGISFGPVLLIGSEETEEQSLLRRLRAEIASIERRWGLL